MRDPNVLTVLVVAGAGINDFLLEALHRDSHPDNRCAFSVLMLDDGRFETDVRAAGATPLPVAGTGLSAFVRAVGVVRSLRPDILVPATPADEAVTGRLGLICAVRTAPTPTDPVRRPLRWDLAAAAALGGAGDPPDSGPAVSVLTTVLNEKDGGLADLVEQLLPQLRSDDELLVVDGGSTDGTLEYLRAEAEQHPALRVVEAPGTNISAGRNIGVGAAKNDVVVATDAGCDIDDHWVEALRRGFNDPDVELVTGAYEVVAHNGWQRAYRAAGYPWVQESLRPDALSRLYARFFGGSFEANACTGRSVGFRRRAWERVGGFPEHLRTGEDVTFGRQIVATGGRAALSLGAKVRWEQRPTIGKTLKMYASYGRGDGESGDPKLIGRNIARSSFYLLTAAAAVTRSRSLVGTAVLANTAYLSLPVVRALRAGDHDALAVLPFALASRDLAKIWGCTQGLVSRRKAPTES